MQHACGMRHGMLLQAQNPLARVRRSVACALHPKTCFSCNSASLTGFSATERMLYKIVRSMRAIFESFGLPPADIAGP